MRPKILLLNLPDPPGRVVNRGYAGGFGTAYNAKHSTDRPVFPVYLLYAASALEKSGCRYEILDAQGMGYGIETVKKIVGDKKPDIILSWISLPSFYHDIKCLNEAKSILGEDALVAGWGTTCKTLSKDILQNSKIDLILNGEYPYYSAILTFAKKIREKSDPKEIPGAVFLNDGKYFSNPPLNEDGDSLNRVLFEVYHKLPVHNYICTVGTYDGSKIEFLPIVTSAGCSYACNYCPYPTGYGRKIKYKSIDKIIEEIKFLQHNFKINCFLFRDQNFLSNRERVLNFCDKIIKENIKIKWFIEARTDLVSRELLQKMKQAGCIRIHFGVESGSSKLANIAKPGSSLGKCMKAFKLCRELKIVTLAHMIVGLPGENRRTVEETLSFLFKLRPDYINVNVLTPYPGTGLYEIALKNNWISTFDWSKYTSYNVVMRTNELSVEEIEELKRYIERRWKIFKFIHNSGYKRILDKIIKIFPSSHRRNNRTIINL